MSRPNSYFTVADYPPAVTARKCPILNMPETIAGRAQKAKLNPFQARIGRINVQRVVQHQRGHTLGKQFLEALVIDDAVDPDRDRAAPFPAPR